MNEYLKFSWGHIIAFLALIIISYISFVGETYKTDGDFTTATIIMVVIDIFLFVFFIGAQMMKATERKFERRIWIERFFIFCSPIVFILAMVPYFHFSTVHSHDGEIVGHFKDAISSSEQMFSDYDAYSNERIENYEHMLDRVTSNYSIQPDEFTSCGFIVGKEDIQKANMVKTLRLQLLSENYDSLRTEATKWIKSSSKGASTWNVFLLGNTKEIKNAIHNWNAQLVEFSNKKISNEEFNGFNTVKTFGEVSGSLDSVDKGLDGLTDKFTQSAFPPFGAILCAVILYFSLLFPYILQDRHTKSLQRFWGKCKGLSNSLVLDIEPSGPEYNVKDKKKNKHVNNEITINPYDEDSKPTPEGTKNSDNNDDYSSFTIK